MYACIIGYVDDVDEICVCSVIQRACLIKSVLVTRAVIIDTSSIVDYSSTLP